MKIGIILPHLKMYGGVRRYIEFGNKLLARNEGHEYTIYVLDNSTSVDWIQYNGRIAQGKDALLEKMDACICGDASSLILLPKTKATLKVVNVIFPMGTGPLGAYENYLGAEYIVVGNGTGWNTLGERPNFYTIPGAVNTEMFHPVEGEDSQKFRVLFFSKQRTWKGVDTILAAKELLKADSDIEWQSFDNEAYPYLPKDQDIIQHIGIPQNEMCKLYSSVDVFVSAEKLAGWQNTTAEAMACGVPVITTRIGTMDFAFHHRTAIVIEPDKPELIVKSIKMLKASEQLRHALAQAGFHTIKKLSWENYTKNWLDLLNKLMPKPIEVIIPKIEIVSEATKPVIGEVSEQAKAIKAQADKIKLAMGILPEEAVAVPKPPQPYTDNKLIQEVVLDAEQVSSKPFDKYKRMGAYHWDQKDAVYEKHIEYLVKLFLSMRSMHGAKKIFEIGCGDGRITGEIARLGFQIHGIDVQPEAVELAKQKLHAEVSNGFITLEVQDYFKMVNALPYILASEVIEHIYKPELFVEKVISENPEVAIITTPIAKTDGKMWDPSYHVKEFTKEEFIAIFKPYNDRYMISHTSMEPYHQYVILERKDFAVTSYLHSLGLHLTHKVNIDSKDVNAIIPVEQTILSRMQKTISGILDTTIKFTKVE